MKKFLFCLFALLAISGAGNKLGAQTPYVGGALTADYSYGYNFHCSASVLGGYEFNDRWALGGGIGLGIYPFGASQLALYARWTPWHNDVLFLDVKLQSEGFFGRGFTFYGLDAGLVGSLRFRVGDHIDIFADLANLGAQFSSAATNGAKVKPMIGIVSDSARMGLLYRF